VGPFVLRPLLKHVLASALCLAATISDAAAEEYVLLVPPLNSIERSAHGGEATTDTPLTQWLQVRVFESGVACDTARYTLLQDATLEWQKARERFTEHAKPLPEGPPSESWSPETMAYYHHDVKPVGMDALQKAARFWQVYLGKCVGGSRVEFRDRE
jgi:hypothetical protein